MTRAGDLAGREVLVDRERHERDDSVGDPGGVGESGRVGSDLASAAPGHVPVLVEKVIEGLAPVDGAIMVDATYGGGGDSKAALAIANCTILAVDRDPEAMERAWAHAGKDPRLVPAPGRFSELDSIVRAAGYEKVDGVIEFVGVGEGPAYHDLFEQDGRRIQRQRQANG